MRNKEEFEEYRRDKEAALERKRRPDADKVTKSIIRRLGKDAPPELLALVDRDPKLFSMLFDREVRELFLQRAKDDPESFHRSLRLLERERRKNDKDTGPASRKDSTARADSREKELLSVVRDAFSYGEEAGISAVVDYLQKGGGRTNEA